MKGTLNIKSFCNLCFCWTWTNLVYLCVLASVIGEIGRYTVGRQKSSINVGGAIVRGFFVVLITFAGQLVTRRAVSLADPDLWKPWVGNAARATRPMDPQVYRVVNSSLGINIMLPR
jgi:hypothetical protein